MQRDSMEGLSEKNKTDTLYTVLCNTVGRIRSIWFCKMIYKRVCVYLEIFVLKERMWLHRTLRRQSYMKIYIERVCLLYKTQHALYI